MATLLDHRGLPIQAGALKQEIASPKLYRLRSPYAPAISDLSPEFIAGALRQSEYGQWPEQYLALAEAMEERDLHYRSVLATRKMALAGLEIIVEPFSTSRQDKKIAQLVREVLSVDEFADIISDQQDALSKGFSVGEIEWDTSGSEWRPNDIIWRDQRWFGFSQENPYWPMLREGGGFIALAPYKFVVHLPKLKSGLPLRGGIARAAAWAFMAKNYTLKDWLAFSEVFGMPLRIGKYPIGSESQDIDVLMAAVAGIGSDFAAVIPETMQIELAESTGKSASSVIYRELADYLDKQVSKAVLGQTETADATPGRLGNATEKDAVRQDILRFDARQSMVTNKRDLITPLVRLNFGPDAALPNVRFALPETDERELLINAVKSFVPLGWKVDGAWLRDKFGIPDADERSGEPEWLGQPEPHPLTDTLPEDNPQAVPAQRNQALHRPYSIKGAGNQCPQCGSHAQGTAPSDLPVSYANQLEANAREAHQSMLEVIRQEAESAESMEALRDRLLQLYPDIPSSDLREVMAAGFALATLAGRYTVKSENES